MNTSNAIVSEWSLSGDQIVSYIPARWDDTVARHGAPAARHGAPAARHGAPAARHGAPAVRHVAPLGHISMIPSPTVFALISKCCVL